MKILVTGFEPFGGEKINPAFQAVKMLPDIIEDAEIIKLEIPTAFTKSAEKIENALLKYSPDVIISVGQAGGRANITVEKVAINLADASIPDNDGYQPIDEVIKADGDTAYFTNLPIHNMIDFIRKNNIPASISYSAGTYVCNYVMYNILYLINKKYNNIKGGFIHVPYCPAQAINKYANTPTMSLENISLALKCAISAIIQCPKDIKKNEGTIA
ncbi:MAG: pyroglutamyl-peptidase I [Oscillospiraceae bacterium]